MNARRLVYWAGACIVGVAAVAQGGPPETAPGAAPLGGPRVVTEVQRRTLVRRDFEGRIIRPMPPVERAAVDLLDLDADARNRVEAVFDERARLLDEALLKNFDLLLQADGVAKTGTPAERAAFFLKAVEALGDVHAGGGLEVRVRRALPPSARQVYDRLMREYWDAVVEDSRRGAGPKRDAMMGAGDPEPMNGATTDEEKAPSRVALIIRERGQMLGQEIQQTFERMVKSGGVLYAFLTRGMDLTPDQVARVKAACAEYMQRNPDGEGSPGEHARLAGTILPMLNDEQRQILRTNVAGGYRAPTGKPKATPGQAAPEEPPTNPDRAGSPAR